ncbi:MAG: (Fe-S)-binding protein [Chloroflexi bacterium]|nr:(Fe-S)-binding protein [Chloroflexota bacterium]
MPPLDIPARPTYWNVPESAVVLLYVTMFLSLGIMAYQIIRYIQVIIWSTAGASKPEAAPHAVAVKEDKASYWAESKLKWPDRVGARLARLWDLALRQRRITRQLTSGFMHLNMTWGFIILLIGTILATVDYDVGVLIFNVKILQGNFYLFYELILDIFGLLFIVGLTIGLWRRYAIPSAHRWQRLQEERAFAFTLLLLLGINVSGFFVEALRLAVTRPWWAAWSPVGYALSFLLMPLGDNFLRALHLNWWIMHFGVVGLFFVTIPLSNLLHIVSSPANIFMAPFKPQGVLDPILNLEEQETFGAGNLADFTAKQRLGMAACTYCGRCTAACPATAAGTLLSPKAVVVKLNKTLQAQLSNGTAAGNNHSMAVIDQVTSESPVEAFYGLPLIAEEGAIIQPDELWACTTCLACVYECPVLIEIVQDIVDMRRYLALSEGEMPQTSAGALQFIERQGNPWGYPAADRHNWLEDMDVPFLEPGKRVEYLYWVGCAASYDRRNQTVARAVVKILKAAGVDFAVMAEETCNGDPARRLGNEYLFQMLAQGNIESLAQYQFDKVITQCPHCFNVLKNEYPQFGGNYSAVHHSQVISELISQGRVKLKSPDVSRRITFHDSCYLGRYNNVFDAPRQALVASGNIELVEMPRSREKGFCCGGGGGHMWMEVPGKTRINQIRMDEAISVNPDVVGVACPFCMSMMEDARKVKGVEDRIQVKDISEIVAENMV